MKQSNWLGEPLSRHEHEENGMTTHSKHLKLRTSPTVRKKKETKKKETKEGKNAWSCCTVLQQFKVRDRLEHHSQVL